MVQQQGEQAVRNAVRQRYAAAARTSLEVVEQTGPGCGCADACCGGPARPDRDTSASCCASSCCGTDATAVSGDPITSGLYDAAETPFEAALAASLGCGNPTALAQLEPGQDVLDLGSGGGLDVLLSARRVAPGGTAYGLDMTPEMLALAERNRVEAGVDNATFLRGVIEDVPLPDAAVDVVISNCVINLSPNKAAVIREAFRVLRPGGRFAVSDIVLLRDLPEGLQGVVGLWTGCVAGALRDQEYLELLSAVGFEQATVEVTRRYDRADLQDLAQALDPAEVPDGLDLDAVVDALEGAFASAFVRAVKPDAA